MVTFNSRSVQRPKQGISKIDVAVNDYGSARDLISILSVHPHVNHIYFPDDSLTTDDYTTLTGKCFPLERTQFLSGLNDGKAWLLFLSKKDEQLPFKLNKNVSCIDLSASLSENEMVIPEGDLKKVDRFTQFTLPGPVATAIVLALLPFTRHSAFYPVSVTAITPSGMGSNGGGQSDEEIMEEVRRYFKENYSISIQLDLDRWSSKIERGIFISSSFYCPLAMEELKTLYNDYFNLHPFVQISEDPIFLQQVAGTNQCLIHFEKAGVKLIVHSAIDEQLKGSAGLAIQLMNVLFEWEETAGLESFSPFILNKKI